MVEQPLDLHRGWSQRRQFLRRVLINTWNIVVPPDNTTLTYNSFFSRNTGVREREKERSERVQKCGTICGSPQVTCTRVSYVATSRLETHPKAKINSKVLWASH